MPRRQPHRRHRPVPGELIFIFVRAIRLTNVVFCYSQASHGVSPPIGRPGSIRVTGQARAQTPLKHLVTVQVPGEAVGAVGTRSDGRGHRD